MMNHNLHLAKKGTAQMTCKSIHICFEVFLPYKGILVFRGNLYTSRIICLLKMQYYQERSENIVTSKIQSNLDISKLMGLFLISSNYPKCKLIWLRVILTCKKFPTPNYCWRKQSKCIFDSDRRFELRRIRDIQCEISWFDCT